MDQQKRFILAMVISGLMVLGWQYYFAPQQPPPGQNASQRQAAQTDGQTKGDSGDASGEQTTGTDGSDTAAANTQPDAGAAPEPAPTPKKVDVETREISTDTFTVGLTNDGARVVSVTLQEPAQYKEAGNLLGGFERDSARFPFGVEFDNGAIQLPDDLVYEIAESSEDRVVFRYVDPRGNFQVDKIFATHDDHPYSLEFDVVVTNLSKTATLSDQLKLRITGYKDPNIEEGFFEQFDRNELETICRLQDDTEREILSGFDEGEEFSYNGTIEWGAVNTRYFLWGVIPDKHPINCDMKKDKGYLTTTLTWDDFSLSPGSSFTYDQILYAGPKDLDILDSIGHHLTESVDYGILTILAKPLRAVLNFLHKYVGNWGLAIILLTILIKILTWPFTEKSYSNAERMKEIQPQLDELREKYENDQTRLAEETMKLFKENSFNPLGGCFPMLLQMPILYALYVMIINSVELYQADFILWYTDLSSRDPYYVLPILMGIAMFAQQRFMTPTSSDPKQQQTQVMMKIMPVIFTSFMLFLPSGLVLYYSLNLILGVFQQFLIKRKFARRREEAQAA